MTRMERAIGDQGLGACRGGGRSAGSVRRGRCRCAAAPAAISPRMPLSQGLPLPALPWPVLRPGLAGLGAELGPGHQPAGGAEDGHVQADLGDDGLGSVGPQPGSHPAGPRRAAPGAGACPGAGPGGAVGVDAPGGRDRCGSSRDPARSWAILAARRSIWSSSRRGELAVVVIEHAVPAPRRARAALLAQRPRARSGQDLRVALPGDHRLDHDPADRLRWSGWRSPTESLISAPSSSFSSRCQHRVRSCDQVGARPG